MLSLFSPFSKCNSSIHSILRTYIFSYYHLLSQVQILPSAKRVGARLQELQIRNDQEEFSLEGRLSLGRIMLRACGVRGPDDDLRNKIEVCVSLKTELQSESKLSS